jgi:hypothetical protein
MKYYYSRFVRWLARGHIEPMAQEIHELRNALQATRMQLYNLERRGSGGRRRTDGQAKD